MKIRRDSLDILFSKYIRMKAGGICEYCGKGLALQCSHFHGRRKRSTRWDEENCCVLCMSCHMYLGEHPNKHCAWFKKRLGSEKFEKLNIRAEIITKLDKEEIKASLLEKLKILEGN